MEKPLHPLLLLFHTVLFIVSNHCMNSTSFPQPILTHSLVNVGRHAHEITVNLKVYCLHILISFHTFIFPVCILLLHTNTHLYYTDVYFYAGISPLLSNEKVYFPVFLVHCCAESFLHMIKSSPYILLLHPRINLSVIVGKYLVKWKFSFITTLLEDILVTTVHTEADTSVSVYL